MKNNNLLFNEMGFNNWGYYISIFARAIYFYSYNNGINTL